MLGLDCRYTDSMNRTNGIYIVVVNEVSTRGTQHSYNRYL